MPEDFSGGELSEKQVIDESPERGFLKNRKRGFEGCDFYDMGRGSEGKGEYYCLSRFRRAFEKSVFFNTVMI